MCVCVSMCVYLFVCISGTFPVMLWVALNSISESCIYSIIHMTLLSQRV